MTIVTGNLKHQLMKTKKKKKFQQKSALIEGPEKGPPNKSDGEGNGTPLQYSRLENPMDGGAW